MKQINLAILKAEIKDLQEAINEQLDELIERSGKIPQIEYDIIMDNIRKIYSDLQLLYRYDDLVEKKISDNKAPLAEQPEKGAPPVPVIETPLIVVEAQSPTGNHPDVVGPASESKASWKLPVNIKSLININDKFSFINELFDGNLKEYSMAIEKFNSLNEKRDNLAYLEELTRMNAWDAQSPAFRKFREIIEQRFA